MQRSAWPAAVPWDPVHAPIPPELDRVLEARLSSAGASGAVPISALLVVASETAWHDAWSVRAAIALADHLAQSHHCLVLDLALEGGELHPTVEVENLEGVADIFLYGASLKHVVVRPPGHRFEFAPAGLGGEPKRVLTDTRWRRLLSEQQAAGILLIGYVPAHSDGLEILSDRIPNIIALARTEELSAIADRLSPDAVAVAVIAPLDAAVEEPAPAPEPVPEPAPEPVSIADTVEEEVPARTRERDFESIRVPRNAAREALIADLRARQRAALMAPAPAPVIEEPPPAAPPEPRKPMAARGPVRPQPSLTEPSFVTAEQRPTVKSRKGLYIGLSLVVLAALIVGAWLVIRRHVELSAEPPDTAALPAVAVAPPVAQGPVVPLPYSVAVEAHQELPLAADRVEALTTEEKDIGFYIAPILVDSVLYYRIMAGPVADSAAAETIMQRLLEKGHKTGKTEWDVRRTSLAFTLGDYERESDARSRLSEAADLGIPAYVIEVATPDGARRYRVYAGAYAGLAEADLMRRLLRAAGLPDSLIPRVGVRK